jgi:hypothetical protein
VRTLNRSIKPIISSAPHSHIEKVIDAGENHFLLFTQPLDSGDTIPQTRRLLLISSLQRRIQMPVTGVKDLNHTHLPFLPFCKGPWQYPR